jgi:hypothetical protein
MPAPRPPVSHSGQVVTIDWNPPTYGGCSGSPFITAQLTVVGDVGQTDAKSQGVNIDLKPFRDRGVETSFTSFLEIGDRGLVTLNQARTDVTSGSTPFLHVLRGVSGKNTIEAYVQPPGVEGLWRFDFTASTAFDPGSLRVESGSLAVFDGRTLVFQLKGDSGERIRFTFGLSRD